MQKYENKQNNSKSVSSRCQLYKKQNKIDFQLKRKNIKNQIEFSFSILKFRNETKHKNHNESAVTQQEQHYNKANSVITTK